MTSTNQPPDWAEQEARIILEHVNTASIELAFVRHSLVSDEFDEELDTREEEIERIKQDTFNCLTGDDVGCLSEEELDETNCEIKWLAIRLREADQHGYRRGMQEREAQLISKLETVRSDGSSLTAQLIQAEQEGYERGIEEERQRAMDLADGMIDSLSGMSRSAARQEVVRELKRRIETWAAVEFDGVAPGCALLPAETEETNG